MRADTSEALQNEKATRLADKRRQRAAASGARLELKYADTADDAGCDER